MMIDALIFDNRQVVTFGITAPGLSPPSCTRCDKIPIKSRTYISFTLFVTWHICTKHAIKH